MHSRDPETITEELKALRELRDLLDGITAPARVGNRVEPAWLRANGLFNPFTDTKTWQISCGRCEHTWRERLPLVETCSAICPCCGAQNVWSLSAWFRYYERVTGLED